MCRDNALPSATLQLLQLGAGGPAYVTKYTNYMSPLLARWEDTSRSCASYPGSFQV